MHDEKDTYSQLVNWCRLTQPQLRTRVLGESNHPANLNMSIHDCEVTSHT